MLNIIKDKIEDIKYLILDVILKCLMKIFKMKEDELSEAFIKTWRTEYEKEKIEKENNQ